MDDGFVQTVHGLRGREVFGTPLRCFKQEVIGHRVAHSQSLMKKDLRGHFGCVNAIEFSSNGKFIASGKKSVLQNQLSIPSLDQCCPFINRQKYK